jgi:hypothetical protein
MENGTSQKRPAEEAKGDDETQPSKRTRLEPPSDENQKNHHSTSTSTATNFLPTLKRGKHFCLVHLQILRALYTEDPWGTNNGQKGVDLVAAVTPALSPEDGLVEDKLWETIQKYLRERDHVRAMAQEVEYYEGVHDEALAFMKEEKERVAVAASTLSMSMSSSYIRSGDRTSHPFYSSRGGVGGMSFFSQQQQQQSHVSPRPTRFSSSLLSAQEDAGGSSFGLIAGLLKRKYHKASDHLQQSVTPFRPLRAEVGRRIQTLEGLLLQPQQVQQQQVSTSTSTIAMELGHSEGTEVVRSNDSTAKEKVSSSLSSNNYEPTEEVMARMETKLRLWNLLQSDLDSSG